MNIYPETNQRTEPILWITGSTKPGPHEKRTCVELVTQLAQDGWAISANANNPIGSLAQRSARAIGGKLVPAPTGHPTSNLAGQPVPHLALPRRLWDARTAGLCTLATTKVRGRLIVSVDLTPATASSGGPGRTAMRSHIVGVER